MSIADPDDVLIAELNRRGWWVERFDPYYHARGSQSTGSNDSRLFSYAEKRVCPHCERQVACVAISRESYEYWLVDVYYPDPAASEPTGFWLCSWWPSCGKRFSEDDLEIQA